MEPLLIGRHKERPILRYCPTMLTSARISRRALTLRDSFLALHLAGSLSTLPSLPLIAAWRSVFPHIPNPSITLYGPHGRTYERSFVDILESVSTMGFDDMLPLFSDAAQVATAIDIADSIKKADLHDKDEPLLEFLRHYRNGCAHGGAWNFSKGEPRNLAAFGDLRIDQAWQSQKVTTRVLPYTHVRLLEEISNYFGPPAPQSTQDGWRAAQ